jgi:dienelactone hydrolase
MRLVLPIGVRFCGRRVGLLTVGMMVLAGGPGYAQVEPDLWGPLEGGPYAVGFGVEFAVDPAGKLDAAEWNWNTTDGRPLRLLIWYPAESRTRADGPPKLTMADYLRTPSERGAASDMWRAPEHFEAYNRALTDWDADVASRQFSPSSEALVASLRALPVRGRPGAEVAVGSFPLVVHSLGRRNYQQENTVLWEYLASHGYIVVVVPQVGPDAGDGRFPQFIAEDMSLQADDMAFAIDHVSAQQRFSVSTIGVVGHSLGGMTGAFLASRRSDVRALAGLDASFGTDDGVALFNSVGWHPDAVSVPILDVYAGGKSILDLSQIDAWASRKIHLAIGSGRPPDMALHVDFQMWPLFLRATAHEDSRVRGARPRGFAAGVLWTAIRATRLFFDATLKEDASAWSLLLESDAVARGIDPSLVTVRDVAAR